MHIKSCRSSLFKINIHLYQLFSWLNNQLKLWLLIQPYKGGDLLQGASWNSSSDNQRDAPGQNVNLEGRLHFCLYLWSMTELEPRRNSQNWPKSQEQFGVKRIKLGPQDSAEPSEVPHGGTWASKWASSIYLYMKWKGDLRRLENSGYTATLFERQIELSLSQQRWMMAFVSMRQTHAVYKPIKNPIGLD